MRVAVLGGGYAGLTVASRLEARLPADVELVVVDEDATHLVQHELHRVVRRPRLADELQIPLADLLEEATIRRERVERVDPEANAATLADGETLAYDFAAVCLGAETAYYDLPGVADRAQPLKRVPDAHRIRETFLADVLDGGRAVVGGAGLSGVQVAGELAALAREQGGDPDIVLLEQFDEVAPEFPRNFRTAVREALEERDVEVRTGVAVTGASDGAVALEPSDEAGDAPDTGGEELPCDQLVWTGGIRGPGALGGERPAVGNALRLGRRTFVVGDAARVVDAEGEAVPASAQAAVREGRLVAANLARLVEYERDGASELFEPRLEPFRFESRGWLVSVGDGAVAQVGPTVLTGAPARALKTTVGAGYLTSVGAVRRAVDLVRGALEDPE